MKKIAGFWKASVIGSNAEYLRVSYKNHMDEIFYDRKVCCEKRSIPLLRGPMHFKFHPHVSEICLSEVFMDDIYVVHLGNWVTSNPKYTSPEWPLDKPTVELAMLVINTSIGSVQALYQNVYHHSSASGINIRMAPYHKLSTLELK